MMRRTRLREIRVELIDDGVNVRESVDHALVDSIRRHGVLQPIAVRAVGSRYQVVMGFRRLAAARELGLELIPATLDDSAEGDRILRQLAENVHRKAMNPIEIARALKAYLDEHPEIAKQDLAAALGWSKRYGPVWVSNKLALLKMDDEVVARIEAGEISESQAIAARQLLGDGRGRPRVVPTEAEVKAGRSRSISIPIGHMAGSGTSGTVDISVDRETAAVDMAIHTSQGRGMFLSISPAEARLWGRRLLQAGDALEAVAS